MLAYVVEPARFRQDEDIAIAVCVGRFGSDLRWTQELYTRCIQHSGVPDIWADAYHALHRYESAQLISEDGPVIANRPVHYTTGPRSACDLPRGAGASVCAKCGRSVHSIC